MSPLGAAGMKMPIALLGPGAGGSLPWGRMALDELVPVLCTRFSWPRGSGGGRGDKQAGPLPVLRGQCSARRRPPARSPTAPAAAPAVSHALGLVASPSLAGSLACRLHPGVCLLCQEVKTPSNQDVCSLGSITSVSSLLLCRAHFNELWGINAPVGSEPH